MPMASSVMKVQVLYMFLLLHFQYISLTYLMVTTWLLRFHVSHEDTVQFSLVVQYCLTVCDPMDYGTPGLPVHHQLPQFTQTYVHCVGDAI